MSICTCVFCVGGGVGRWCGVVWQLHCGRACPRRCAGLKGVWEGAGTLRGAVLPVCTCHHVLLTTSCLCHPLSPCSTRSGWVCLSLTSCRTTQPHTTQKHNNATLSTQQHAPPPPTHMRCPFPPFLSPCSTRYGWGPQSLTSCRTTQPLTTQHPDSPYSSMAPPLTHVLSSLPPAPLLSLPPCLYVSTRSVWVLLSWTSCRSETPH
jgi:hypothetical protein